MTAAAPALAASSPVATARLAWVWTRFEIGVWLREPAAVLLNMSYPLIMLAFFFIADTHIRTEPAAALALLGSLSLVGILMVCLNFPANGVPEARAGDFYPFSRTLPAGPVPRLIAWIATPILCGLMSAVAALGIGTLLSAAQPRWSDVGVILGACLLLAVPTALIGLALGFVLTTKTSLPVSLTLAFALILLGGISGLPMPEWIDALARVLPSGAAGTLISGAISGQGIDPLGPLVLLGWTAAGALAAIALYRRDEGKHFR